MTGTAPSVLVRNCAVACSHLDRTGSKKPGLDPGTDIIYKAQRNILLLPRPRPQAPGPNGTTTFANSTAHFDAELRDNQAWTLTLGTRF